MPYAATVIDLPNRRCTVRWRAGEPMSSVVRTLGWGESAAAAVVALTVASRFPEFTVKAAHSRRCREPDS